jgi:hypothetical protein
MSPLNYVNASFAAFGAAMANPLNAPVRVLVATASSREGHQQIWLVVSPFVKLSPSGKGACKTLALLKRRGRVLSLSVGSRTALLLIAAMLPGCGVSLSSFGIGGGGAGGSLVVKESTGPTGTTAATKVSVTRSNPFDAYIAMGGRIKRCWFNATEPLWSDRRDTNSIRLQIGSHIPWRLRQRCRRRYWFAHLTRARSSCYGN